MDHSISAPKPWRKFLNAAARVSAAGVPDFIAEAIRRFHFQAGQPAITHMALRLLRLRPASKIPNLFPIPDCPHLVMTRSDSVVCAVVYWLGQNAYEGSELDWWAAFCAKSRHVIEVGANVGLYTLNGAAVMGQGARYRAVEPHPISYAALDATLRANRLDHVELLQVAAVAAGQPGEVRLHIPPADRYGAPAGAHVQGDSPIYADGGRDGSFVTVRAINFAELVTGVDLIKIDVEGLEADLLGASIVQIMADRPTIFVEVLDQNIQLKKFIADLQATGAYHVYRIDDDGVVAVQIDQMSMAVGGRLRDVILSPLSPSDMAMVMTGFRQRLG